MAQIDPIQAGDPDLGPGAYVTNGESLYEVTVLRYHLATLRDAGTGQQLSLETWKMYDGGWELIRPAPTAPDTAAALDDWSEPEYKPDPAGCTS